jgi:hypothetical protein
LSRRSRKPRKSGESRPRDLAEQDVRRVNESFYSAKPHEFFRHRITALMVMSSRPEEVARLASEGLSVGTLKVGSDGPPGDDPDSIVNADSRRMFTITEAEVLAHHVGETLLRLYMAHEGLPVCPAWELAKIRTPRDFKTRVRKRFLDSPPESHLSAVSSVFFGFEDADGIEYVEPPPEGKKPDSMNVEKFLRHHANHHLNDANVYNAAKHGLAVTAGNASMQLGDGSVLKQDGDAVTFLETVLNRDKKRQWQLTTAWVRSDVSLAFALLGCRFIEQLWAVARARYIGSPLESIKLMDSPQYDELMEETYKPGIHAMGLSMGLFLPADG